MLLINYIIPSNWAKKQGKIMLTYLRGDVKKTLCRGCQVLTLFFLCLNLGSFVFLIFNLFYLTLLYASLLISSLHYLGQ